MSALQISCIPSTKACVFSFIQFHTSAVLSRMPKKFVAHAVHSKVTSPITMPIGHDKNAIHVPIAGKANHKVHIAATNPAKAPPINTIFCTSSGLFSTKSPNFSTRGDIDFKRFVATSAKGHHKLSFKLPICTFKISIRPA